MSLGILSSSLWRLKILENQIAQKLYMSNYKNDRNFNSIMDYGIEGIVD